ncbi:Hypothetical predicted protein [Mytilus galloprovincialis]|uniref:BPTI/Kunitz inhibitor domain-containing protein n=1 Tax=Mytilus galloprovincialis TaxID=29158 RepID=A0A8B6ETI5_MYTGA|nr:Hypothetical predicted protein [Mytilus galloprovincialis]
MNKNIISLGLCMCSILLLTSAHRQKRSIFSVRKYNPLSPNEVQYYLQELQELKQRLNGGKSHGSKSRRRDRHSKKGGKRSGREEPTWRAGMSWWDSTHGKKSRSSSGSWASSSSSYKCDQPIAYGNTDCTAHTVRYYYEKASKMCRKFHYTGCGGNKNNFHSKRECMRRCRH